MSLWKSYLGLSRATRLSVGVGVLLWGTAGLYFSDSAADRMGMTPTDADRESLEKMIPKIHVIDHEEKQ